MDHGKPSDDSRTTYEVIKITLKKQAQEQQIERQPEIQAHEKRMEIIQSNIEDGPMTNDLTKEEREEFPNHHKAVKEEEEIWC